ncbi:MAG: YbaB/EbfC family nucleoid-associated protein [Streptosporangiales bacterium]|nr:YbaB/EbfC family nucleoid-associated protein [Streptosporangiales bacterium]
MIPGNQNMNELLEQAQQMQQQMMAAQEELAESEVVGVAGGGLVQATVTGTGELKSLAIDPKAVDPDDTETLADLVVAAVRDATANAQELQTQRLGPLAQMLGGGAGPGMLGG